MLRPSQPNREQQACTSRSQQGLCPPFLLSWAERRVAHFQVQSGYLPQNNRPKDYTIAGCIIYGSVGRHQLCEPFLELSVLRNQVRMGPPALKGTDSPEIYSFSCRLPPGWSQKLQHQPWDSAQGSGWLPHKVRPTLHLARPELVSSSASTFSFPPLCNLCRSDYRYLSEFLNLGTIDIWNWIILHCGAVPCIIRHLTASRPPPSSYSSSKL